MEACEGVMMATDVWSAVCPHNCITIQCSRCMCVHNKLKIQCSQCSPAKTADKGHDADNSWASETNKVQDHLTEHNSASSDCYIMDLPDEPFEHGNSMSIFVLLEVQSVVSLLSHYITEEQMLAAFAASKDQPLRCPRVVPVPAKTVAKTKQTIVLDALAVEDADAIADIEEQHEQNMAALYSFSMHTGGGSAPRRSLRVTMDRTVVDAALDDQADKYEEQKAQAHEKYRGFVVAALNPWNMHAADCSSMGPSAVVDGCNCKQPLDGGFHRFWCGGRGPTVTFSESVLDAGVIGVGPDLVYRPPSDHAEIVSNHVDLVHFNKTPFNSLRFPGSLCPNMELAYDGDEDV